MHPLFSQRAPAIASRIDELSFFRSSSSFILPAVTKSNLALAETLSSRRTHLKLCKSLQSRFPEFFGSVGVVVSEVEGSNNLQENWNRNFGEMEISGPSGGSAVGPMVSGTITADPPKKERRAGGTAFFTFKDVR